MAYAQFEEGKKGELKVGEYADFILLSDDLTKIPPSQYTKVRVLRAVVGGKTLYQTNQNSTVIWEAGFFLREGCS